MTALGALKDVARKVANAAGVRTAAGRVLERSEALVAEGRISEALEYASAQNKELGHPVIERRLVEWRLKGGYAAAGHSASGEWPRMVPDPFPGVAGTPEIQGAEELTSERLAGGILHHGAVIVRGLLSKDEVQRLRTGIDRAFDARVESKSGSPSPAAEAWYSPVVLPRNSELPNSRDFEEEVGAMWSADSPRMLAVWLDMIRAKGLDRLVEQHLGERPTLAVRKSTLRRVEPQLHPGGWHQDGAFLGGGVRTVNMWVTLSDCGRDASGLDYVPRRVPEVVETGTEGAMIDWLVADTVAKRVAGDLCTDSPIFREGDAMFFDHLLLHRTAGGPNITKRRYAMETWFFAPSTHPANWEPLLI